MQEAIQRALQCAVLSSSVQQERNDEGRSLLSNGLLLDKVKCHLRTSD